MAKSIEGAKTTYLLFAGGINFSKKKYMPKKAMFREVNSFKTAAIGASNKTYIFASNEKSLMPNALSVILPSTQLREAE